MKFTIELQGQQGEAIECINVKRVFSFVYEQTTVSNKM